MSVLQKVLRASLVTVVACASIIVMSQRPASAAAPKIFVTFGFDDGRAGGQPWAGSQLAAKGVKGTFYLNSAEIGTSGYYMSMAQIRELQSEGHEIGGHTLDHQSLGQLTVDQQRHEICDDRSTLLSLGFPAVSFAYPYGDAPASAQQLVTECGYKSGRDVGGLSTSTTGSGPWSENVPPSNTALVETPGSHSLQSTDSLDYMKSFITNAQNHNGGCTNATTTGACWVNYIFHTICEDTDPNCNVNGVTKSNFSALLDYITSQSANGVVMKSAAEVMGAATPPPPPPTTSISNPSLDTDANNDGVADCWTRTAYGTNTATWSRVPGHTGVAEQVNMSSFTSGDRKLINAPTCAVTVTPGQIYTISAWYKGGPSARFAAYIPNSTGGWDWWAQSAIHTTASDWTQFSWTTPAIPAGVTSIRFGESLLAAGTLAIDDFAIIAGTPPPPPPSTTISNPSFETDANNDGVADCWTRTAYGDNTATWSRVAGHTGIAEQVTISAYTTGDRKIINAPNCAVAVTPGRSYTISAWYKGGPSARFAAYIPNSTGGWDWWAQSSIHTTASNWTQVSWTTPVIPSGVTSIRFGESLIAAGTIAVDDFTIS